MKKSIRRPAVAGRFYPIDPNELENMIKEFLVKAEKPLAVENTRGMIVPHAGYVFSGQVAASAFKNIEGRKIGRVVLIGNAHSESFNGVAIDDSDIWLTPLGEVQVDNRLAKKLVRASDKINFNSEAHENEHVLEVELPFLQIVLQEGFKIIPVLLGSDKVDWREMADILEKFLDDDDLVVVSSDMSHYPEYNDANWIDQKTLKFISDSDINELDNHISDVQALMIANEETLLCSLDSVKTIISLSENLNWQAKTISYANSGDSILGDKKAVVGYGAVVFFSDDLLNKEQKKQLIDIAKKTVEHLVKTGEKPKEFSIKDERFERKEGVFVTLKKDDNLRGCIGNITPVSSLWENVRDMAAAAAREDERFTPITQTELNDLKYEISVLSVPEKIEDWQKIEPGRHGVIITKGLNRGVFLPQVAKESGWGLEEFLSELCSQKAGLNKDCYKNDQLVEIEIFTAQVFSEKDLQ